MGQVLDAGSAPGESLCHDLAVAGPRLGEDGVAGRGQTDQAGASVRGVGVLGDPAPVDQARFDADLAADAMASEKLAEGIAAFAKDLDALRADIASRLA